jgi:hypothetical protein
MSHASGTKNKHQHNPHDRDTFTDRRARMFASSAYRHAKQNGFLTGEDVLKSVEEAEEGFNHNPNTSSYRGGA